jgi:hypothetical protein
MAKNGGIPGMETCNMMPCNRFARIFALATVLAVLAASCAVQGGPGEAGAPPPTGEPAARMGLAPELRPLYDALEGEGDWVLVEPQGWVFRPRVNTVAWRPYQDGHWEPSYAFGWVWESHDPFGWITDHYGFWFYDDFQGWLWKPYGAWAPSWVAWVQVGNFVGWAPLPPAGTTTYSEPPGGTFTYVPVQSLAQNAASTSALHVRAIPDDGSSLQPIERTSSYLGVYYNTGPDVGQVLGTAAADQLRIDERDGRVEVPVPTRRPALTGPAPSLTLPALTERTRGAWTAARREFIAVRPERSGSSPGVTGPPATTTPPPPAYEPPRIKPDALPSDTLQQAPPPDSLKKHLKHGTKPKNPKTPKPTTEGAG